MPFNLGIELMAKAAAPLFADKVLVAITQANAHGWLQFPNDSCPIIRLVAQRFPGRDEVRVSLSVPGALPQAREQLVYDAIFHFADSYPLPPQEENDPVAGPSPGGLDRKSIYPEHMFHGPTFQTVASLQQCGEKSVQALLDSPSADGLQPGIPDPLLTAPLLIDGAGQVVGLWAIHQLKEHFVIFPDGIAEIRFYGAPDQYSGPLVCRMTPELQGTAHIVSNGFLASLQGEVHVSLAGLRHRRIFLPEIIHRFRCNREVELSTEWPLPLISYSAFEGKLACGRLLTDWMEPEGDDGEMLLAVIAHIILSRRERELWHRLGTSAKRRREWLFGRLVTKETVRRLCHFDQQHFWPADIEILPDTQGKPVVYGPSSLKGDTIHVSLSHTEKAAVAIAAILPEQCGIGIDIERLRTTFPRECLDLAFSEEEQKIMGPDTANILRGWCAKEAVAKSLGIGLQGNAKKFVIHQWEGETGRLFIEYIGDEPHSSAKTGQKLVVNTQKEGSLIVATSIMPADG